MRLWRPPVALVPIRGFVRSRRIGGLEELALEDGRENAAPACGRMLTWVLGSHAVASGEGNLARSHLGFGVSCGGIW